MTITIVSAILGAILAIISFVMVLLDSKEKQRKLCGLDITDLKKYFAFLALCLGILSIMFDVKEKVNQNSETIARQSEVINRLSHIISNTDPISGATLKLSWSNYDTIEYHSLMNNFRENQKKIKHHNFNETGDTLTFVAGHFNRISSVHLYFLDSTDYKKYKDSLFTKGSGNLVEPSRLLEKLSLLDVEADEESGKLNLIWEHEEKSTDGYGRDTDYIWGRYDYPLNGFNKRTDNLGFANLADLKCIMTLWENKHKYAVGSIELDNYNSNKAISFNLSPILLIKNPGHNDGLEAFASSTSKMKFKK